jgi:hypothetical protein
VFVIQIPFNDKVKVLDKNKAINHQEKYGHFIAA